MQQRRLRDLQHGAADSSLVRHTAEFDPGNKRDL